MWILGAGIRDLIFWIEEVARGVRRLLLLRVFAGSRSLGLVPRGTERSRRFR